MAIVLFVAAIVVGLWPSVSSQYGEEPGPFSRVAGRDAASGPSVPYRPSQRLDSGPDSLGQLIVDPPATRPVPYAASMGQHGPAPMAIGASGESLLQAYAQAGIEPRLGPYSAPIPPLPSAAAADPLDVIIAQAMLADTDLRSFNEMCFSEGSGIATGWQQQQQEQQEEMACPHSQCPAAMPIGAISSSLAFFQPVLESRTDPQTVPARPTPMTDWPHLAHRNESPQHDALPASHTIWAYPLSGMSRGAGRRLIRSLQEPPLAEIGSDGNDASDAPCDHFPPAAAPTGAQSEPRPPNPIPEAAAMDAFATTHSASVPACTCGAGAPCSSCHTEPYLEVCREIAEAIRLWELPVTGPVGLDLTSVRLPAPPLYTGLVVPAMDPSDRGTCAQRQMRLVANLYLENFVDRDLLRTEPALASLYHVRASLQALLLCFRNHHASDLDRFLAQHRRRLCWVTFHVAHCSGLQPQCGAVADGDRACPQV